MILAVNNEIYFCLGHGKTRYQVSGDGIVCSSGKTFTIAGSMKSPWKKRAPLFWLPELCVWPEQTGCGFVLSLCVVMLLV